MASRITVIRMLSKVLARGAAVALLLFMASSSSVLLLLAPVNAQQAPLFSATLIVSSGNPVRRAYAKDITDNMVSLGIDAKLVILDFDQIFDRLFFTKAKQGSLYRNGGYDMGFLGWGFTSPVPDFRSNLDGRYMAPGGSNYALYDNPEVNALFDELSSASDVQAQVRLMNRIQEIVFHDKPYNYVYEPISVVPRDPKWTAWGDKSVYNAVTFPDVEHWAGGTELTFAEVSSVFPGNTLNPIQTSSSNSFYALYVYGAMCFAMAGLQYIDARDNSFKLGIATDIQSSPDGKTWTVKMKQGVLFHSGVEMTADDALFTQSATLDPKAASVGLGSAIQYLGNVVDFTYLDGTKETRDNRATPDEAVRKGEWHAVDRYTFQFTMPEIYAFTRQVYCAFSVLPKHIMEQFPSETWDSQPFSTAEKPFTYKWDTKKYGGTGSYTALGPVGAGTYILTDFDFTRNMATMKKFQNHWARAELEAAGMFTVETYKVVWIESKDAAIAALKNGQVDVLDTNYQLANDVPTLQQMGVNIVSAPELGWQEQSFNMRHPVLGTGIETPLGKSDPSQAAEGARHVRTAISHLIPRDQITRDLMAGLAYPMASFIGPGWGTFYDPDLKPDSYDINAAADELRAAGYSPWITATATSLTSTSSTSVYSSTVTSPSTPTSLETTASTAVHTSEAVQPPLTEQNTLLIVGVVLIVAVVAILAYWKFTRKIHTETHTGASRRYVEYVARLEELKARGEISEETYVKLKEEYWKKITERNT